MISKVLRLPFLIDITNQVIDKRELRLFKDTYKVFEVKNNADIQFRIASDWSGQWLTGAWYFKGERIKSPEQLLELLSRRNIVQLAYHLDDLQAISDWNGQRYIEETK